VIRLLNGKDPYRTVCVKGLPDEPILYHQMLANTFAACADQNSIQLHYDSNRAFVEFKDLYDVKSKIARGIYFSMALHKCNISIPRVLHKEEVVKELEKVKKIAGASYINGSSSRFTTG
jgi:hypothetical protein